MTRNKTPDSPTPAQQARATYQRLRYMRPAPAAIDAPEFADPLLPDLPGDEPNMLPHPHAVEKNILIPYFDVAGDSGDPGILRLLWNNQPVGANRPFTLPLDPNTFPWTMTLPATQTANHGRYTLGYRASVLGNPNDSGGLSVFIDNLAPNLGHAGERVVLPAEVEADGITRAYLDANSGEVEITIPTYGDIKIDDQVFVWYGTTYPGRLLTTFRISDPADPIVVTISEADFNAVEGQYLIYYLLRDRTGNEGPPSSVKFVQVYLDEVPENLQPPLVPQFDDSLIDLDDALEGVGVQINQYDNALPDDRIRFKWEGFALSGLIPVDPGAFPLFGTIPFATVRGTPADWGPKAAKLTYEVLRGSRTFPEPTGIDLDIDLRVPGPIDPNPDPEVGNPNLAAVVVQGAVTTQPNELLPADVGQDATATVALYAGAVANEVMHLLWNGVEVDTYTVTGSEPAGFIVPFTIPWVDIEAEGNNSALPVRYTITHAVNGNLNRSPIRPVLVNVITIVLPAITFQNLDPDFDLLNCSSLRQVGGVWGLEVRVAGAVDQALAGQTLTFTYQGWTDSAGTIPKPNTTARFTRIPTDDEALNGFTALIPYSPAVLETLDRYGSITYELVLNGIIVNAPRELKRVYMSVPGGGTCALTFKAGVRKR